MIPDYLQQGLGLPPPVDDSLAGAPDPYGGLHPAVAQALGFTPQQPVPLPQAPPTQPLQLPSAAEPQPQQSPAPSRDFHVPAAAIDGPGTPKPPKPAAPPKPMTPEQGFAAAGAARQAAEQGAEAAVQQQAQAMAPKNAEDLAAAQAHKEQADAIAADQKRYQDEHDKAYATSQAQIAADNKALDSYKVDQGKYWKDAGIGTHIGWYIAMAMSGLGDAMQGKSGPNPVIQMLQDKMHQSVVAQVDARDQLKEKRGRNLEAKGEVEQGFASRNAEILRRDGANDRAFANALALAAAKSADPIQQAQAAKLIADLRLQSADKQEAAAKDQASYAVQKQQNAIAGGHLAETRRHNLVEEGWQKTKFEEEQNLKAAALLAKQQGKLSDEETKRAVFVPGPDGRMTALRKTGGELVLAGDPAIAQKQRDMVAAATSYNRLVGQMSRAIADHGGESTWIKGKEWQKMESDLQSATAELHDAYGITAFREPTVKFFEKMASAGVDPTSFVRDATGALQESNMNLQAKVNEKLGALGYDGPAIKWQDTTAPPAPLQTPEDTAIRVAMGSRGDDPGAVYDPQAGKYQPKLPGAYRVDPDVSTVPPPSAQDAAVAKNFPKMGPAQRSLLEMWGAALQGGDPALRDRAASVLEKLSKDADEQGVRDYAAQLLQNNVTAGVQPNPTEQTTTSSRGITGGRSFALPALRLTP